MKPCQAMHGRGKILLSLGSNVEPRTKFLSRAIFMLNRICYVLRVSSAYETKPWGYEEQPNFLNLAVLCIPKTGFRNPLIFLREIKKMEKIIGRKARGKWREREIDIDIILWGKTRFSHRELVIPHIYFRDREFVLVPAVEIAPFMEDPETGKTVRELVEDLKNLS